MNVIKAFVGHSFTVADADVVDKFLKFFTRLEKMNTGFSWVHAEAAEPKQLTDKVMALIEDRNLFIGICTRKELAVEAASLSKFPLLDKQYADSKYFEWKTSDWIIQEIGLAKGRNLEMLLLIENGVRKPGGLQGDVEYISFDRSMPEAAFGKIVEMITALTPQSATESRSPSTSPPAEKDGKDKEIASESDWRTPSPSWRRAQYEIALFHFIYRQDDDGIKAIDKAFLSSSEAHDPQAVAAWNAYSHFYRLTFGKGGDLKVLQALAIEFPDNARVHEFYARALSKFEKHLEAATEFELAAQKTTDMAENANWLGEAAVEYARTGQSECAEAIIRRLRQSLLAGAINETQFLNAILRHVEVQKNKDLQIAISERLVDLSPDDYDARFSLAYMHSEVRNEDLSLNHYLKIPPSERGSITWNNLGAAFDHFDLPVKAVRAYRKSEDMNETLGMANLGGKMLDVGFFDEARAICERALAVKNYHKNVGHLLVRLNDVSAEEEKKQDEVLQKSRSKVEFYRAFGRAISAAEPQQIEGPWIGPECVLNAVVRDGEIEITGEYERDANPMGIALGMLSSNRKVRKRIEYRGTLSGRAIFANVRQNEDGDSIAAASLLSQLGNGKALMFLSDDETELSVVENPSSRTPKFVRFRRGSGTPLIALPSPQDSAQ